VVPLAVGAVLLAVFVVVERRSRDPLLPARLLRRRRAIVTDVAALTVLAAPFGVSYLVTVYVQGVLGRSPWTTAVLLLPGAVLSALVGQLIAGRFLDRFGLRATFAGALVVVAVGDAGLLALSPSAAFPVIVVAALVALGLGMGVAYPAATLGGITGVDEVDHGTAAGLTNTALQLGGGLGLAVVAALLAGGTGGADLAHAHPDVVAAAFRDATFGAVGLPLVGALVVVVGLAERRPSPGLS
jgi:MFS family permease